MKFGRGQRVVSPRPQPKFDSDRQNPEVAAGKFGIAGEAHSLVYGERAKTYGHPRKDFTIIATVWTGLLRDLLKDGAELDAHRVAIMMTGLKLARLVKSPGHHDSRVDTIGYMLTMERLDEPDGELPGLEHAETFDAEAQQRFEESYYGKPEGLTEVDRAVMAEEAERRRDVPELKNYVFPVDNPDDPCHFNQKVIEAYTYKEARAQFDRWNDEREEDPVLNPLTGEALGPGEVVASLGDSPTETANPSDADVELALDILKRRQDFHDREAVRLLAQGDGISLS